MKNLQKKHFEALFESYESPKLIAIFPEDYQCQLCIFCAFFTAIFPLLDLVFGSLQRVICPYVKHVYSKILQTFLCNLFGYEVMTVELDILLRKDYLLCPRSSLVQPHLALEPVNCKFTMIH